MLDVKASEMVFIHSREFKGFRECKVYLLQEQYVPFLEVYIIVNANVIMTIRVNGL